MRKVICIGIASLILLASVLIMAPVASANVGGFTVTPGLPENQDPGSRGYFDLWVNPGQRQDIVIRINSTSDREIEVLTDIYTATTNLNGIVDYSAPGRPDESLRHDFADIARLDQDKVTIPAGAVREVTISLAVPDEGFDGVLLGAINTTREPTEEEKAAAGMIVNRYSVVTVVRLRQKDDMIETELLLGDVTSELVNRRAAIIADIRNPVPRLMMGVTADAQVYPLGGETPIFEMKDINVDFAPNSIFPFTMIDYAGFGLRAGKYVAMIQLEHEGKSWRFEHEFEILDEEAKTINTGAVNQQQAPPEGADRAPGDSSGEPPWVIIAAGVGALLLAIIIVLVIMMRKSSKRAKAAIMQMDKDELLRLMLQAQQQQQQKQQEKQNPAV